MRGMPRLREQKENCDTHHFLSAIALQGLSLARSTQICSKCYFLCFRASFLTVPVPLCMGENPKWSYLSEMETKSNLATALLLGDWNRSCEWPLWGHMMLHDALQNSLPALLLHFVPPLVPAFIRKCLQLKRNMRKSLGNCSCITKPKF